MPVDVDGGPDWRVRPLLDCPGCGYLAPWPNFLDETARNAAWARSSWHVRYHAAQADPRQDTMAKMMARRAGRPTIMCACGQAFPAELAG